MTDYTKLLESKQVTDLKPDADIVLEGQYKDAYDAMLDAYHAGLYVGLIGPVGSGKTALCRRFAQDLFVPDRSKGQAALCVLLDISGSMGGRELANCAISVVMLLGRLEPQEIAIAVFESDTHVIKGFSQEREIDEVTDYLLELAATGGTRVDAALRWAYEQFDEVPEAEFRMLFLLSDFEFFESPRDLDQLTRSLASQNARYIGAAHGHYNKQTAAHFQESMGGELIKLRNLDQAPQLLMNAIRDAAR